MTDETPMVGRFYCPGCEPGTDPVTEIVTVSWCGNHAPVLSGSEDSRVVIAGMSLGASGEADGTDCRLAAEALRPRSGSRRAPVCGDEADWARKVCALRPDHEGEHLYVPAPYHRVG